MVRPFPDWGAAVAGALLCAVCITVPVSARPLAFAADGRLGAHHRFLPHGPAQMGAGGSVREERGTHFVEIDPADDPFKLADTQLEPLSWSALDGWGADDHIAAFAAFAKSCTPFLNVRRPRDPRPIYRALWEICRRAATFRPETAAEAQAFFEENFRPVAIARIGDSKGLLTGYWEPVVEGSRMPNPEFHTPLYRRPRDLLVDGRPPRGEVPNRAVINRRDEHNALVPYYDRGAIEAGALDGQHLEICWLRDPFDVLAIQIQGSAQIVLEDGTILRVNYDSHNGHGYTAVGRVLIEQYGIPAEQMSMDRIRQWMLANPDEAAKVRARNASYVFFRITGLSGEGEAVGGQGVPLSPGRSVAVDRLHVYGTPFFISASLPIDSDKPATPFRRLMIAQDTGSAIIGPARADLYWGAGDRAGRIAGRIRQQGQFVMLLPAQLDMVEAGRHMPLPLERPPAASIAVAKTDAGKAATGRAEADKANALKTEATKPETVKAADGKAVPRRRNALVRRQVRPLSNSGL